MSMLESYVALRDRWKSGDRERKGALHLMFFAWMHWAEPSFLTGLADNSGEPVAIWREVFDFFGGEDSTDAEFLFVAALMAELFPYELGDYEQWTLRARRLLARARELQPQGMSAAAFEGQGKYGEYFAHQSPNFAAQTGQ